MWVSGWWAGCGSRIFAHRPPRTSGLCVFHTETLCVCHTETLCVDHIQECQNLDKNHEIWSESGPYGSVRAHIQPESIPQGLGSLWDTSRALKPPEKIKNPGFRGLGEIPPIPPYFPGLGSAAADFSARKGPLLLSLCKHIWYPVSPIIWPC